MKRITSKQNPLIKYLVHLQSKSSFRKKEKKFLIEGRREVRLAIEGGYKIDTILFMPEIFPFKEVQKLLKTYNIEPKLVELGKEAYERVAYRETTEGIIAVAYQKEHSLNKLRLSENPLILVAENIEKPGNIGAMLRTADAANIDALIIANPITDLYNPNIVRSSVGGLFTVQVGIGSTQEVIQFLKENKITLFAAALQNSVPYYEQNFCQPTAIAVGSEAKGLTDQIRNAAFKNILIPMEGKLDSLNVSVSAAILIFEAKRQRKVNCRK